MTDRFPLLSTPGSRHRPSRYQQRRPRSISSQRSFPHAPTPVSHISGATDFLDAPEMPDISDLLSGCIPTRLELANMMCRTSMDDVERLPAIHPHVASARGETFVKYMSFVSRPPQEWKTPRHRPRTIAVVPRLMGPEKCIRCQLRTEHIRCQKHKYLRVGGGFRHSYWYIKKIVDAIEKNERFDLEGQRRQLLIEREREMAVLRAQAEARARADILAAKAKSKKRRIKTYVRTVTGEVVSQYHFLSEKDYKAMKKDKKKAKKLLGLKEDEKLEDWKSSKHAYEENKEGEIVKVKRPREKDKITHGKDSRLAFRDIQSVESGIGRSIKEGDEGRISRYTVSRSKHVKWDNLSDHSDRPVIDEEQMSRKEKKKKKKMKKSRKKEERIVMQTEEINPLENPSQSSSESDSGNESKRKKKRRKKRKKERKKEKKRLQRRQRYEMESDTAEKEDIPIPKRRSRRKAKEDKPRREKSWSPAFGSYHDQMMTKRKPKRRKQRYSDSESVDEPERKPKMKASKSASKKTSEIDSGSSSEEESSYDSDTDSSSSGNSSGTESGSSSSSPSSTDSDSETSSDSSTTSSSSTSSSSSSSSDSEVSDVSSPSDVSSSDVSDVENVANEEERKIKIAEKKQTKVLLKRAQVKEKKLEAKKEAKKIKNEIKKEVKIQKKFVKEERKQEREERREIRRVEKKQKQVARKQEKLSALSVSDISDVGSISSDEISDVDETLDVEEKEAVMATKKALIKAQKMEQKLIEKKEEKLEEIKEEKKREKKNKKVKKAIIKELKRTDSSTSVSSVHSSDLSNIDDLEEVENAEEKSKIVEELKEEKQQEKKVVKLFQKAIKKVIKKKYQEAEDWEYDDEIDDSVVTREARRKKEFKYLLPKEAVNTMVKMSKGSRGLTEAIKKTDGRGMEWFDDWQKRRDEEKRERERLAKEENDEDELLNLLKSTNDNSSTPKPKQVSKRTKKKKQQYVSDDESEEYGEEEIPSAMSNLKKQEDLRRNRLKNLQDDNEELDGVVSDMDPPSSPSELGKIRGVRRVNRMFKDKPDMMQSHLQSVLNTASELNRDEKPLTQKEEAQPNKNNSNEYEVKHTSIDFVSHYRLVEAPKVEPFGRAFVVEDEDHDCCLEYEELRSALDGVQSLAEVKHKQIEYVLKVLGIDHHTKVTFKMFAVVAAVCERMCSMDPFGKYLVDQSDLMDIERKMTLYKSMFYCNSDAEHGKNHVKAESVRIDLIAGGLNREQEQYVMSKLRINGDCEISFFDYMAYIPLFLTVHDNIIDNPLDMSTKYNKNNNTSSVRDMNPLGLPLKPDFIEYPKEIYPSGIPPGRPLLQSQGKGQDQTGEPNPTGVDIVDKEEGAESVSDQSIRPPSEISERLPSISSRDPSARSSSHSATSWQSESLP